MGKLSQIIRGRAVGHLIFLFCTLAACWASASGGIAGVVKDASGAVLAGATVALTSSGTGMKRTATTTPEGSYAFPSLPVGRYDIEVTQPGFASFRAASVVVDANSSVIVDAVLQVGARSDSVTVSENTVHVDTSSTQMGELIDGTQMTSLPLNGRSYTDLLALQPGVAPATSLTSESVQDVGVSALSPSGSLSPGTISINGQREFANAFIVNGSNSEEDVNAGTTIVPNLDSIAEFRILRTTSTPSMASTVAARSMSSRNPERTPFMAISSNFCATPTSTRAIIFPMPEAHSSKINLVGLSAVRWCATRFSSSQIIRERGKRRESIPA
jgi:hypothetical protein